MPRGTALSQFERGQIAAMKAAGTSNKQISKETGRSMQVIRDYLKDPVGYGTHKTGGPKPKLTPRDKRALYNAASNKQIGVRELARTVTPHAHYSTVHRAIQESPNLVRRSIRKRPRMTSTHFYNRRNYLARQVYKDSKQYGNRRELEKAISKAFREMPDEILRNHADRQHERVAELLEKQGRETHY
ncbi:tc3 transposase domain-containing protein [Ditylenchus destructor]|uniref:Tc3 transposase domain-containing protein n=1 Tax=Ditylenchus destructor TaxID=166010 RepID=A0AAD4MHH5_9BILA|nr:tc3 transposase domain-containing protein [Ditylenchus destructor]